MDVRFQMTFANPRAAVQHAFGLAQFDQGARPSIQAAGVSALFVEMCRVTGVSPSEAIAMGAAYLADGDIAREASALRDLVNFNMKGE